jgi:hypothetical protein
MTLAAKQLGPQNALLSAVLGDHGIEVYEGAGITAQDLEIFFESTSNRGKPKNAVVVVTAADGVHHLIRSSKQVDHLPNMEGGYDRIYAMLATYWRGWKTHLAAELVLEHIESGGEA